MPIDFAKELAAIDFDAELSALNEQPQPDEKSVGGFLSNVVDSGADVVGGALSLLNPANLYAGIERGGAMQRERIERRLRGEPDEPMPAPLADRYGSLEKAGNTLYNDPIGAAVELMPLARPVAGLSRIKGGLQEAGVRTMRGAVKPNTGDLRKMAGSSQAGLDQLSDDVARTALAERVNPMTKGGLGTIQGRVETLGAERDAAIAAAPQAPITGSGRAQLQSLKPVVQKYGGTRQSTPQADLREIQAFARDVKANPSLTRRGPGRSKSLKDLTPDELNQLNKGDNRALSGKFGKVGDAEIDARKAVVGARRDLIEDVVPGTKATGQRMRKLIDLRNVANVARKRGEGRDVLGINDMIALSSGRPETFLLSTAMRPAVQAGIAGGLHRTGAALPSQIDLTGLYRLALMQQLSEGAAPEQ